jgi:hypothetical protein
MGLESLTVESFSPLVGTIFTVRTADEAIPLELVEATALAQPGGWDSSVRSPFNLIFRGPLSSGLVQQIYRLEHADLGVLDIFLVPIQPNGDGARYEAIFS